MAQQSAKTLTLADLLAMPEFAPKQATTATPYAKVVAYVLRFADGHTERLELSETSQRLAMVQAEAAFVAVSAKEPLVLVREGQRQVYGFEAAG